MASNIVHICSGDSIAPIFAVPTLDDFWMTWATVRSPCGCASEIVAEPIVSRTGAQAITVSKRTLSYSSASAAVNGFITEPGS